MRKTGQDQARGAVDLPAMAAERFPLVPRPKPVCRTLETRVTRVRELADLAGQGADDPRLRAAEAHNLAALILSDCGLPALARDLCWRQAEVFLAVRPLDAATAKLALQPLINLARLLIRDGNSTAAYHVLEALFEAIKSRTDAIIGGKKIGLADLVTHDDHREVVHWMWTVLLSDGTRALTRAGRWTEALHHARQHKGIGDRLLDGRQVAILAHCETGDHATACRLLADSLTPTPWEGAVAACLRVLCGRMADRPSHSDVTTVIDRYLGLESAPDNAAFHVRLGLCVVDVAAGDDRAREVADMVVRHALDAADAYAARDALTHASCMAHTSAEAARTLTEMVQASGLVTASSHSHVLQGPLLASLLNSARTAEAILASRIKGKNRTVN